MSDNQPQNQQPEQKPEERQPEKPPVPSLSKQTKQPEHKQPEAPQPTAINASALQISETDENVAIILRHNQSGHTVLIRAQNVICAMPLMIASRIIAQPQHYGSPPTLPPHHVY